MEKIAMVRDGSDGEIKPGYWTFEAIDLNGKEITLLMNRLFSVEDRRTPSFPGVMQKHIERIIRFSAGEGIHVLDRGFDGKDYIEMYYRLKTKFILRLVGDRTINTVSGKRIGVIEEVADKFNLKNYIAVNKKGKQYLIKNGWFKIKIPGVMGEYTLLIARSKKGNFYLLTNIEINNEIQAEKIFRYYFKRWSIEDVIRFAKQVTGIEKFLVRSYKAIKRLNFLAALAVGVLLSFSELSDSIIIRLGKIGECFKKKVDLYIIELLWG